MVTLFIFVPLAALGVIGAGIVRWAVNKEAEGRYDGTPARRRLGAPFALLIAMAALGLISLLPEEGRTVLTHMQTLLGQAADASETSSLPPSFQNAQVSRIIERARAGYTLQWEKNDLNRFHIPFPIEAQATRSAAIAHFEDGSAMVCMFNTPGAQPRCRDLGANER
jgi:hypothetical protein